MAAMVGGRQILSRVLVTGGTGFIGRSLCPVLVAAGAQVSVATRNPRVAEHIPRVDVRPIPGIGPRVDWSAVLRDVSDVVHLAARVPALDEGADEQLVRAYQRINVDGARKLAEDAAAAGVRRFVFLSTAKVHGERNAAEQPFREDDAPGPAEPYARSKWQAEQALAAVARTSAMELVVLRPPLVYGPRVQGNFRTLLRWSARMRTLPLAGIRNRRSLIFVDNLADAIAACLAHPAAVGTFLVRDGEDLATAEIVRSLASGMGRRPRPLAVPPLLLGTLARALGKGAAFERLASSFCVDDARIRREVGWTPPFTVLQGLQATGAWYTGQGERLR